MRSSLGLAVAVAALAAGVSGLGCPAREQPAEVEALPAGAGTSTTPALVRRSYRAMGTDISVSVPVRPGAAERAADEARALKAMQSAFVEFSRLEALMSTWRPSSDVSRINSAAGRRPVRVSPEVIELLAEAGRWSARTGGKFDVTFGALSGLWRFDHDQDDRIPDPAAVAGRVALVDHSALVVDAEAGTAFLQRAGMKVHVGGLGKGYAVDRAVAILKDHGLESFMVQAGGDLYVAGARTDRPWRIGIRDPRGPEGQYFAAAEVKDATFSTSGDYERFFIQDGVRHHHILDPDTGMPARGARSVTILAPSALIGDALSTSVFLLGVEAGLALVEATEGAGAVIVGPDNAVHVSRRLEGKVRILRPPTDGP